MSKNSNKQRLIQLKEWMESRGKSITKSSTPVKKFSKADYYKEKQ